MTRANLQQDCCPQIVAVVTLFHSATFIDSRLLLDAKCLVSPPSFVVLPRMRAVSQTAVWDFQRKGIEMEHLFDWLIRVATLLELALQIAEKVLARRGNDEPDKEPE